MARRRTPPSSPRRRTYRTGANLPALTTDWRPIPLGRDENGEPDGQVRALAVLLRNRSDSAVYIREGPENDDAFEIAPGEDYRIWESNGVNSVALKGDSGGETVEVRTLEAHNDFDLTDRIDAFARSIAHFIQTATSNTTITGQDIDLSIDDAGGIAVSSAETLSIAGNVDASGSTVTVDELQSGSVDASGSTVTVEDIIAGSVTIDDITSTSATFDVQGSVDASGSTINGGVDVTGQSDFELSVRDIEGTPVSRFLSETFVDPGEVDTQLGAYIGEFNDWTLFDPATTDGFITGWEVRIYQQSDISCDDIGARLQVNRNEGDGWDDVMPRAWRSTIAIQTLAENSAEATIVVADENRNCTYRIEPRTPIKFREGDSVRFRIGPDTNFGEPSAEYDIEMNVNYIERRGN